MAGNRHFIGCLLYTSGKYTELIEQYHYDSEEEKMEHKIEMELNGWNDSGQVMEMVSGFLHTNYTKSGGFCL